MIFDIWPILLTGQGHQTVLGEEHRWAGCGERCAGGLCAWWYSFPRQFLLNSVLINYRLPGENIPLLCSFAQDMFFPSCTQRFITVSHAQSMHTLFVFVLVRTGGTVSLRSASGAGYNSKDAFHCICIVFFLAEIEGHFRIIPLKVLQTWLVV